MNGYKNWMKKKLKFKWNLLIVPKYFQRLITSIARFLRRTDQNTPTISRQVCVFFFKQDLMVNNDVLVFSTIDNKCSWTINNINGRNKTSSHTIKYDRLAARDRPNVNVNCHWISKHLQFLNILQSTNGFQFYDHSLATNKMALIILLTVIYE